MRLKDAMRDHSVGDVAEAWLQLVAQYSGPRPELAAAVLEVVRRYVNWIDIGLVANDRHACSSESSTASSDKQATPVPASNPGLDCDVSDVHPEQRGAGPSSGIFSQVGAEDITPP